MEEESEYLILTPLTQWDRSIDGVLWSPDSQFVIANASDRAKHKLWKIRCVSVEH